MKIYCVVGYMSRKVYKVFHHKTSAITWADLHESFKENHFMVVRIDLDEYMKQIM